MKCSSLYLALLLAPWASADGLRDPTRPPMSAPRRGAPAAEPVPSLTAIMGVAGARRAIVDGRLVRNGSVVGSFIIDEVFADGIRYRRGGVKRELRLPQNPSIKKPSEE